MISIVSYRPLAVNYEALPPFANTKSLSFDGADDYVDCGNDSSINISGDLTLSAWVFIPLSSNTFYGVFSKIDASTRNYELLIRNNETISFYTSNTEFTTSTNSIALNTWTHVLVTVESGVAGGVKFYFNGVLDATTGTQTVVAQTHNLNIGRRSTNSFYLNGNIDEPCIFNRAVTPSEIATLSTAPTVDLTDLNPIAWYRNGDNGSWKSPQWLIPNNENKDKVSNYSLNFDGVDDYLNVGNALNLGINSTISMWIKRGRVTTAEVFLSEDSYAFDYLIYVEATKKIYIRIGGVAKEFGSAAVVSIMNDTINWINICFVRSGDSIELFLNGSSMGSNVGYGTLVNTRFDAIGAKFSGALPTLGNIDEVAAWNNNTVNPLDIYNGGTPTTISGAIAHWKMGEEATLKSPQWLIPNNENKDNVSNYSMAFDGLRRMPVGSITLGTDNIVSLWLKRDLTNTQETLLGEISNTSNYFMVITTTNKLYLRFGATAYVGYTSASVISVLNDTTNWINIIVVRSGNSVELFLNGLSMGTGDDINGVPGVIETRFDEVAGANGSFRTTGAFNNVAAWNVNTVLPSEIFNGGTPPDLSTLSTVPVNWWKMADNSTWTPTTWNVPDEIGTNDGTIDFLDIFGRIGEAPNSTNNALSDNMDVSDRTGEAPNSTNNAVSLNMDFVDVVPDVP